MSYRSRGVSRLLFVPLSLCIAATAGAQAPLATFDGAVAGGRFGVSVRSAGDVDGDGVTDVIVGSPRSSLGGFESGVARVFSGADHTTLFEFVGQPGAWLGASVDGAGDVDGDGYADLVVGSPYDSTAGSGAGSVRVFSGATGAELFRMDGIGALRVPGSDVIPGERLGFAVAGAGDLDDDGYDDVIAGGPGRDVGGLEVGAAHVLSGATGTVLHSWLGTFADSGFGSAVAAVGDVDGDGHADVVVGAPGENGFGSVRVYSGADGSILHLALGGSVGARFGEAVAGVGDVDSDGADDFVVGAPGADDLAVDGGAARVLSGADGSLLVSVSGAVTGAEFGAAVGGGADLEADGSVEWFVGAPGPLGQPGTVFVFDVDGDLQHTLVGEAADDRFGASVDGLRDFDGDLFGELIVGVPGVGVATGSSSVFGFAPMAHSQAVEMAPAGAGGHYGARLNRAGDVNGDGVEDYMVGAPTDVGKFGRVWIYSGADHSVIRQLVGSGVDISFGVRLASAGDVNNDGFGDVIIGAYHDDTIARDSGMAILYSGADWRPMQTFFGPGFRSHLGTAVGGLGDVDNDGVGDVFIGMGLDNGEIGAVRVYSGATGAVLYQVDGGRAGQWFGWDGAAVGDWNGDGIGDFAVGAPAGQVAPTPGRGYVRVLSGVDGSEIVRFNGENSQDRFGWVVKAAGDVNADGIIDLIVGSDGYDALGQSDAGRAYVFSGADYSTLYTVDGSAAMDLFGRGVGGAGDTNGDGYDDFLVGAVGTDPNGIADAGTVYLYSGADGSLLQTFPGSVAGNMRGTSLIGFGDFNGDNLSDLLISEHLDGTTGVEAGRVLRFDSGIKSDPAAFRSYGAGCTGGTGSLPRLGLDGHPATGLTVQVTLRAAGASVPVSLGLGLAPQAVALGPLGLPGCQLLHTFELAVPAMTDAGGRAAQSITVPGGFTPAPVFAQWAVLDPGATGGLAFSDAGRIDIGR